MLNIDLQNELEKLIDATINALRAVCDAKSVHLQHNWQDSAASDLWSRMANRLATQWNAARRYGL